MNGILIKLNKMNTEVFQANLLISFFFFFLTNTTLNKIIALFVSCCLCKCLLKCRLFKVSKCIVEMVDSEEIRTVYLITLTNSYNFNVYCLYTLSHIQLKIFYHRNISMYELAIGTSLKKYQQFIYFCLQLYTFFQSVIMLIENTCDSVNDLYTQTRSQEVSTTLVACIEQM